jgi:acetyl-CoA hydrolase
MAGTVDAVAAAIDLRAHLRPGDTVVWGQACAQPLTLTRALAEQQPGIGPLRLFLGIGSDVTPGLAGSTDSADSADSGVRFAAYGGGGSTRRLDERRVLDVLPARYSDLPRLFAQGGFGIDVAFVQVTPGPVEGTYHFALAAEYLVAAARAARVVVAEVNRQAPHSPDAPILRADEVTAVVEASYRPVEHAPPPANDIDRRIAANVAALVDDGATLQIGIGSLPEAIVRGLAGHHDLGVHSGAIGDAVAELVESGAITNARKAHDAGTSVGGVFIGTSRLFEFAHNNPLIALRETSYTHGPAVLAAQPRLTAINAAIEVDLTGQVNSEVAGGRYVGAAGGMLDFARGAALSAGGVPITVLRSTAGSRSTIVAQLSGPVTLPRSDAGWIVTEYGAVDLRGLTLAQRRHRLIDIAHPDHRETLAAAAAGPGEASSSRYDTPSGDRRP